jgi:hypothetical protein
MYSSPSLLVFGICCQKGEKSKFLVILFVVLFCLWFFWFCISLLIIVFVLATIVACILLLMYEINMLAYYSM